MTLAALDLRTLAPNGSAPDATGALAVPPRHLSDEDWARFEGYAAEILTSFGMDLTRRARPRPRAGSSGRCSMPPTATTATRSC